MSTAGVLLSTRAADKNVSAFKANTTTRGSPGISPTTRLSKCSAGRSATTSKRRPRRGPGSWWSINGVFRLETVRDRIRSPGPATCQFRPEAWAIAGSIGAPTDPKVHVISGNKDNSG